MTIPGRVAAAVLDTEPEVALLGVYVPSRDRSADKTEKKKQSFVTSLLAAIDGFSQDLRDRLVLGGDYNVIGRTLQPRHAGFLPFEFGLLEQLEAHGLVDAHERCAPNEQAYSWIGRTGDGYRYDYFHVVRQGEGLATPIMPFAAPRAAFCACYGSAIVVDRAADRWALVCVDPRTR